uniref:ribose-phosphate diphosphokinase n=1 Tax=Chromera velia CCMP2878 TaxID=1169474 RepID=A0A0G4HDZ6_9ALVE|eukprot:Cvel_6489.t1-p1 / transcript=Cvel_6489.t1 / gene=Cvel_6489 / organism=Chromera_velia_CCMP2878 / gene_product=Ribose-phosphate pyrophosphokinase, putative / transcript_product=Ribose-phosphate pyrophosphokinase, putative / location=Cvel_scaffold318:44544-50541(+) / protein_length=456 / sequence_SO=supercontig / SO=protein_coding / is_pseudo=false
MSKCFGSLFRRAWSPLLGSAGSCRVVGARRGFASSSSWRQRTSKWSSFSLSSAVSEHGSRAALVAAVGTAGVCFAVSLSADGETSQGGLKWHYRPHFAQRPVQCEQSPLWRSEQKKPLEPNKQDEYLVFSGNANTALAEKVATNLSTNLGKIKLARFADGEVALQILESLRGKDVYIIQPTCPPVNEHLMELLLIISTCRRASASKITAIIPYYGYARQDRKLSSRVPISAADVARLIETMGVDRVVAVDLHCGQIQGFFGPRVPVDNLEAQMIGLDYFIKKGLHKPIIVSPDAGGVYRARKFQEGLLVRGADEDTGLAMLIKQRAGANKIERMDLVGSVKGSDVIIVDDMIDTAGTLCEAAKELRNHGAKRVFAFATHGLFSGPATDRIEKSVLEEVVVTDSVPLSDTAKKSTRITQLSIDLLLADAIRRIHQKESLNNMFHETRPSKPGTKKKG